MKEIYELQKFVMKNLMSLYQKKPLNENLETIWLSMLREIDKQEINYISKLQNQNIDILIKTIGGCNGN